jgi:hypothetical protein
MTLIPLSIACPECGSLDVFYSCNPSCCFNHVCSKCYTTFEPVTTKVGELELDHTLVPPDPEPTAPTAACVRCGEHKLFAIEGVEIGSLVCVSCNALLTLEITEVSPG